MALPEGGEAGRGLTGWVGGGQARRVMAEGAEPPEVAALRGALAVSPENGPLRQLLGEALLKYNFFAGAGEIYREGLRWEPQSGVFKLGLARAFHGEGKGAEAAVVLEDLLAAGQGPARAHLLLGRLQCENGEMQKAAEQVKRARELDPTAKDADLEERLEPFLRPAAWGLTESGAAPAPPAVAKPPEADEDVDEAGRVRQRADEKPGQGWVDVDRPKVNFADVGGMEAVKEQIRLKIIHPLANAELFKAYGKRLGGGVLLYGPPGCGKTHLARATAGEVKAAFISVGLHQVLDMWLGQSEKNLHELFVQTRRHRPAVMFIDEVDALGANRMDLRQSAGRNLINQFLAELDGVDGNNDGLLVLAATNAPWHVDPAFRRPGRFDQIIFVPPPDETARAAVLRVLLKGKPAAAVDFAAVARKTAGFSGADLKGLVEMAIEGKLAAAIKTGKVEPLETGDLLAAAKRTRASTLEWFATAKNYAMYANQGGQYDDLLAYLKLLR